MTIRNLGNHLGVLLLALLLPTWAFGVCQQRAPTLAEYVQNPGDGGLGCFVEGENFYVHGPITNDFTTDLRAAFKEHPGIKRIVLTSPGGSYDAGLLLGKAVAELGLDTLVPLDKNYCASSCTYVFQSGKKRVAHPSSRFVYHGIVLGGPLLGYIYSVDCPGPVYTEACQKDMEEMHQSSLTAAREVFTNLESLGVTPALYQRYITQPEDPDWLKKGEFTKMPALVLRATEMVGYGVVQELRSDFQLGN